MMNKEFKRNEHVDELLSGFVDDELTQQDSQRVRAHIENCAQCRGELDDIRSLREQLGSARLSNVDHNNWRESMDDVTVKSTRGLGWLLFIGGILLATGVAGIKIIASFPQWGLVEKAIIGGVYGGLLLVFFSVLRQRLIERKNDRYKDVEI